MIKTKLNYHGYELSFPHEAPVAVAYIERCDPLPLSELIKSDHPLSQGMKNFIADIITGELKRGNGRRATTEREDFDIYLAVRDLVDMGVPLKSNSKGGDTAISLVAKDRYPGLEKEFAVEEAYKRIKKKHFKG